MTFIITIQIYENNELVRIVAHIITQNNNFNKITKNRSQLLALKKSTHGFNAHGYKRKYK